MIYFAHLLSPVVVVVVFDNLKRSAAPSGQLSNSRYSSRTTWSFWTRFIQFIWGCMATVRDALLCPFSHSACAGLRGRRKGGWGFLNFRVSWPTEPALGPYRMWGDFSEAETRVGGAGRGALSRGFNRCPFQFTPSHFSTHVAWARRSKGDLRTNQCPTKILSRHGNISPDRHLDLPEALKLCCSLSAFGQGLKCLALLDSSCSSCPKIASFGSWGSSS